MDVCWWGLSGKRGSTLLTTRQFEQGYMYQKLCSSYKILFFIIILGLCRQKYGRCLKNIISEHIAFCLAYRSTVTTLNLVHLPIYYEHKASNIVCLILCMHDVNIVHPIVISASRSGASGVLTCKHRQAFTNWHVKSTIAYVNSQRTAARRHAIFKELLSVIQIRFSHHLTVCKSSPQLLIAQA